MHSRIFGISKNPKNTKQMNEDEIFDHLHSENLCVDYVTRSDLNNDIAWFMNCIDEEFFEFNTQEGWYMLKPGAKDKFQKLLLNKVIVQAKEMLNKQDEHGWYQWYELTQLINPTGGFYIVDLDEEYTEVHENQHAIYELYEEGKKYYIIHTLDYHQ